MQSARAENLEIHVLPFSPSNHNFRRKLLLSALSPESFRIHISTMVDGPCIGIDLGTTYSCAAVLRDGKPQTIPNDLGELTTPSCVAFTNDQRLIGKPAKKQAPRNPANTVYDIKRFIGRRTDDEDVQDDKKHVLFKIVDKDGNPAVEVEFKRETKTFTPEEISSMILSKLRKAAESYLEKTVQHVVITVPAYFGNSQREATKAACAIAGLKVLRIVNEPTAAALAYGLNKKPGVKNVLVFDLGGGTFDVSLLSLEKDDVFEVQRTTGDAHLGGEDFLNRLVEYVVREFSKQDDNVVLTSRSLTRLRIACEDAKIHLSSSTDAVVEIEQDGIDFVCTISRATFENLCQDLFHKTLDAMKHVISDAGIDKSSVHEIVMVGGSTRIPKIRNLVSSYFEGKTLCTSINADEGVAHGAAALAAMISEESVSKAVLMDVTPKSLGIAVIDGDDDNVMSVLIERNTNIPIKRTRVYSNQENQTTIRIRVFEGESEYVEENTLLGVFWLGVDPAPAHTLQLEVTFEIDENCILTVSAVDTDTGRSDKISIKTSKTCLSETEIKEMAARAKAYEDEDDAVTARNEARNDLEEYLNSLEPGDIEMRSTAFNKATDLLKDNTATADEFKSELDNFKNQPDELTDGRKAKKRRVESP
jgi:L1 cell adhesion molecule like protein